jgi:hypothetical protein
MNVIAPDRAREMRHAFHDSLAEAQEAIMRGYVREGWVNLDLAHDLLDVLGWNDCEPETPVPVEGVVPVLERYADGFRDIVDETGDPGERERAKAMVVLIAAMVSLVADDAC